MSTERTPPSSGLAAKIARDTGSLLTGTLWSRLLALIVGIVSARVLGPVDFGLMKTISFVPMLSKFGGIGFDSVAQWSSLERRKEALARLCNQCLMNQNELRSV